MGLREKAILGAIIFLIIIIPVTAFVISYRARTQTKAQAALNRKTNLSLDQSEATGSSLSQLKQNLANGTTANSSSDSQPEVSFGPTLSFKIKIDGRPEGKQAAKIFLGIAEGSPKSIPSYLLSFNVDVPDSGEYKNLSLAGLSEGSPYTAYLKGSSQVASSSAFILKPANTDLGLLTLISGDLNEDNIINNADMAIAKQAYGTTPSSQNWNPNADFNLDGVVNNFDLARILRHLGTTGSSGPYTSKVASGSATLLTPLNLGAPISTASSDQIIIPGEGGGHWLWVPAN